MGGQAAVVIRGVVVRDGKSKIDKFYHGKSKCFTVFDGLCDMLIIRYWTRMMGYQECNYAKRFEKIVCDFLIHSNFNLLVCAQIKESCRGDVADPV